MPAAEPQRLRLDALDPKDLSMLQQQLQEELQGLSSSTLALQKVHTVHVDHLCSCDYVS